MKNKDLLLVIDMQNVYLPGQEWACPSMTRAAERIRRLLDADVAEQTAFTVFVPPKDPVGTWKQYNLENKTVNEDLWLNQLVDELKPYAARWPVYEKSTYSSMKISELAALAGKADHVVLTGVVAECCILATLMEAIDAGCRVIYLEDCISGQSSRNEAAIRQIAESFAPLHTLVMSSEEYLNSRR